MFIKNCKIVFKAQNTNYFKKNSAIWINLIILSRVFKEIRILDLKKFCDLSEKWYTKNSISAA